MVEAKRIINGTFAEIWVNNDYIAECSKGQAKVEFTKEEIKQCNQIFTDYKKVACKGTGSITLHKVNSRMGLTNTRFVTEYKDERFTIMMSLNDPDAYGAERVVLTGVDFDDLTLFDFEAQKPLEVEVPFTFTGYEYLDTINPQ